MATSFLNRPKPRGLVSLALLLGAGAVDGQSTNEASLRGELVRNADGTLDTSVLAIGVPAVPEALWNRVRDVGGVALLDGGGTVVGEELEARVTGLIGSGGIRRVTEADALPPMGIALEPGGEVRLTWYRVPESEGVAILADARAAEPEFSLRILILDPASDQDDWWGLQAALSQAGIRRVQIVSGRP